jgi:hypothetical protein
MNIHRHTSMCGMKIFRRLWHQGFGRDRRFAAAADSGIGGGVGRKTPGGIAAELESD